MSAYQIWRVDCGCGEVADYGEDWGSVPLECEACGAPIRESDRDDESEAS